MHEFRNHLTVLVAATSELRTEIPPALALQVGEAILETERNLQGLTSLVTLVDASVRAGEPVIARLGDVVDRVIRLAAPASGRSASITTRVPRDTGVRNRGSMLECLLAALVIDLARSPAAKEADAGRAPAVTLEAEIGRGGLTIEIASDGARADTSSWRLALARELADQLDATLTLQPDAAAYVVQFR